MLLDRAQHVQRKLNSVQGLEVTGAEFGAPIDISQVHDAERQLGLAFPESLRLVYTTETSRTRLLWRAAPEVFGPTCRYGDLELLSPSDVVEHADGLRALAVDAVRDYDPAEYPGWGAIARDWPFWIPVFGFGNGDYFCLDMRVRGRSTNAGSGDGTDPPIVFLPHDVMWDDPLPPSHGRQVAENFADLLERWSRIAFVFRFSWADATTSAGIDIDSPILAALRRHIEL